MSGDLFRYPDLVNENAARLIAGAVVLIAGAYLATGSGIVLAVLAYGFTARVLAGTSLSPLALIVGRVIVPRFAIPMKAVPGPPKRFAQGVGAILSLGALVAYFADAGAIAAVLVFVIAVAATLESVFAFCVGCRLFALLTALGVVPASACEVCSDISKMRLPDHSATRSDRH
jgi:hypothetical protein